MQLKIFPAAAAAAAAKSLQSCPTLCNPIEGSPPGSAILGILQARTRVGCHCLLQKLFPTEQQSGWRAGPEAVGTCCCC